MREIGTNTMWWYWYQPVVKATVTNLAPFAVSQALLINTRANLKPAQTRVSPERYPSRVPWVEEMHQRWAKQAAERLSIVEASEVNAAEDRRTEGRAVGK
jgi:hypothetical protein